MVHRIIRNLPARIGKIGFICIIVFGWLIVAQMTVGVWLGYDPALLVALKITGTLIVIALGMVITAIFLDGN